MQCRYCKLEVEKGLKSCPHCGTVNPTQSVREVVLWTAGLFVVFLLISLFIR